MNIVFFSIPPVIPVTGGAERIVVALADWLQVHGCRCFLLSTKSLKSGSEDPRLSALPERGGERSRRNREFFEDYLRRTRADVVVWVPGGSRRIPFAPLCIRSGTKMISWSHGQPDYYRHSALSKACGMDSTTVGSPLKRICLALKLKWKDFSHARVFAYNTAVSSAYVLLSEKYAPRFRGYFPEGNVPCRLEGIGNMYSFSREEVDFSAKKKELLFVGRLSVTDKRPDYLLRIWGKVRERFPDWTLRIVGSGKDEAQLKAFAAELGLKNVVFEGFRDPAPFYRAASVFCLTSAYEGFPMVLLEAAQFGCVPIAFGSFDAVSDIISDGENGFVVPAFDADAYAERLAQLMGDDALRGRFAKNAQKVADEFSPDKVGARWLKLFEELEEKEGAA